MQSDRISFSFSVPKMLIFDGFGHFLSFSAENDVAFSFSVSFSVEMQNKNTEIH